MSSVNLSLNLKSFNIDQKVIDCKTQTALFTRLLRRISCFVCVKSSRNDE